MDAAIGRLASLRRLYHHLAHSGRPTARDAHWLGEPATLESLSRQIRELERQTTPLDRPPGRVAA